MVKVFENGRDLWTHTNFSWKETKIINDIMVFFENILLLKWVR